MQSEASRFSGLFFIDLFFYFPAQEKLICFKILSSLPINQVQDGGLIPQEEVRYGFNILP